MEAWRIRPGDTVTLPVFPGEVTVSDAGLGSRYESTRLEWEAPGMSGALDLPDFTPVSLVASQDGMNAIWLAAPAPRYCGTCHSAGNDDSRLGRDRAFNVEGAGPDGLLADVCEQGHVFTVENEEG